MEEFSRRRSRDGIFATNTAAHTDTLLSPVVQVQGGGEMTRRAAGVGFPTHQISYRLLTRQKMASSFGLRPFKNMKSYHISQSQLACPFFSLFFKSAK